MNCYISKDITSYFDPGPPPYLYVQTKARIAYSYANCKYCNWVYHIDDIMLCVGTDMYYRDNCPISGCTNCVNTISCQTNNEVMKTIKEYQKYSQTHALPPLLIINEDDDYEGTTYCTKCWTKEFDDTQST